MPDHVEAVLAAVVLVACSTQEHFPALLALGAICSSGNSIRWQIPYTSPSALAAAFQVLRGIGLPFLDQPSGWPPAAVFSLLKRQGLVSGAVQTISWQSSTEFRLSQVDA